MDAVCLTGIFELRFKIVYIHVSNRSKNNERPIFPCGLCFLGFFPFICLEQKIVLQKEIVVILCQMFHR